MPSTSVAPKSTLTASGSDKRFTLFTDNWLDVQSYISSALTLPIALGDFTTKYGDFPTGDQQLITGCIDAMKNVNGLSASFGDPTLIKAKIANDPNYLGGTTAPDERQLAYVRNAVVKGDQRELTRLAKIVAKWHEDHKKRGLI